MSDSDEQQVHPGTVAFLTAMQQGWSMVEARACGRCGKPNAWVFSPTTGTCETVRCGACGACSASRLPRLPQPGDTTVESIHAAMNIYASALPRTNAATRAAIDGLTPAAQGLIAAHVADEVRRAFQVVRDGACA